MPQGWMSSRLRPFSVFSAKPRSKPLRWLLRLQVSIAKAAARAAQALAGGGRLAYAAAGSSGLMAMADALELPGTFGIARDRIDILLAEGAADLLDFPAGPEDDEAQAARDVAGAGVGKGDCLIALSASGTTPYAVAALKAAKAAGAATIGIANNEGAPLLVLADIAILLADPAGGHCRLDPHGRGDGPEDRAQHDVDADGRASRPCP